MERDGKCWKILLQRSTDLILEGERCRDGVPTQTNESGMLTTYRETFGKGAKVRVILIVSLVERLWDESGCQSLAIWDDREVSFVVFCGAVERKCGVLHLS